MRTAPTRIREQIDLPAGVATWVFIAHALALLSPFILSWQVHRHQAALAGVLDEPFWLHVSAGLFLVGSAFEIAQNTQDRWYYEGPYPAFSDLLFNSFIAFGLGALGLAAGVEQWWVLAIVAVAAVAFPALYLSDRTPYPATGVLAMVAVGMLYEALRDPAILLLLVFTTGLNLYFLALVVRTKAQSLHGAIALTNGVGLLVVPLVIRNLAVSDPMSWGELVVIAGLIGLAAAAGWRPLAALSPTPRPSSNTRKVTLP